jgi:hypothetical protein
MAVGIPCRNTISTTVGPWQLGSSSASGGSSRVTSAPTREPLRNSLASNAGVVRKCQLFQFRVVNHQELSSVRG